LSYPLVGVITQHNSGFELMHVATLSHVPDLHDLHAA
jgi:hypothetical protein